MRTMTLALAVLLPAGASAAVRPSPESVWKAGRALEPLLQKGRPWALIEQPTDLQLAQAAERLLERTVRLENGLAAFAETASELEAAAVSSARPQERVERLLGFLAAALPAESADFAQSSEALAVMLGAQARAGEKAKALSARAKALDAQADALARRLAALERPVLAAQLGPRAAWLAGRAAQAAAELAWQAERLAELAGQLQ